MSQLQIAEALDVDRKTVRKHLADTGSRENGVPNSKGTTAPTGSELMSTWLGDPLDSGTPSENGVDAASPEMLSSVVPSSSASDCAPQACMKRSD